ncbi:TetR/AcrR family transcriptional regulator [Curtobacterium sp. VKM Ac-1376]|uniref:TetR/AcrR family transcriptional regulator n=1 Tax=Curtobacterium sp. VKM Ac-1376 TaxID=123312 RepID=UPI00188C3552|nr:TetR family transcriptional regulator [Curtobacterium sp. VKM Ac-1376]MBF4616035.1 TetR family transcriptional regulator [Curtobacterium sp. VKM Ac-1376]
MNARDTRQDRGAERQSSILRAAVELLLTDRMSAATHRSVAERAGVPAASIRYYYATREDLLVAALAEIDARRHRVAERVVAEQAGGADRPSLVERVVSAYLGPALDDLTLRSTVGWIADAPRESPRLADTLARMWPGIEWDVAAVLTACGAPPERAALCTRVIDGALLVAVAGGGSRLRRTVVAALDEVLVVVNRPT